MPNYTESCLLTNTKYKEGISTEEINTIINKIREIGAKSVIVTSIHSVELNGCWFDSKINEYFIYLMKKFQLIFQEQVIYFLLL